jgi:DNA repair exonuclease SbcCD ATPase subunit
VQDFREDLGDIENNRHKLYREAVEAANYAAEHPGIHYGGIFETTDLFLENFSNEEVLERLEASLERAEELKEDLERDIEDLRFDLEEYAEQKDDKPDDYRIILDDLNDAEATLENMQRELQHIKQMKQEPPEEEADREYVEEKESKVKKLVEGLDYTPKRSERT